MYTKFFDGGFVPYAGGSVALNKIVWHNYPIIRSVTSLSHEQSTAAQTVLTFLHHSFILHFGEGLYCHSPFYAAHSETGTGEMRRRKERGVERRGEGEKE